VRLAGLEARGFATNVGDKAGADYVYQELDFDDPKLSYGVQSTWAIARALLVFKVCSNKWLVENSESLLKRSTALFGESLVMAVIRPTFFSHFCAGESEADMQPRIDYLQSFGIGSILDYAAEADIDEEDDDNNKRTVADVDVSKSEVHSARQYTYESEQQCDANAAIFADAITAVHNVSPEGFSALKITALCNPLLLERWSTALTEIRNLFTSLDHDGDGLLTFEEFREGWIANFKSSEEEIKSRFDQFDESGSGKISAIEWTTVLRARETRQLAKECLEEGPFTKASLSEEEVELMERMDERVHNLAALADTLGVRLLVDAEHTYFQPAIDNICLKLQRKFNINGKDRVYNTYQCYLKDSSQKVDEYIQRSEYEGWEFAAKIVRGAYMHLERDRAAALGYPSPIHDTLQDTHDEYNRVIRRIIERDSVRNQQSNVNLVVASHNQESVEQTIRVMEQNKISKNKHNVYFGQLLGMADNLTFALGRSGYTAYKYVPYGPIAEVMPYLVRRAQENSDIMGGVVRERKMLWQEFLSRLFPFMK
jgi:proline dehydrogenase